MLILTGLMIRDQGLGLCLVQIMRVTLKTFINRLN